MLPAFSITCGDSIQRDDSPTWESMRCSSFLIRTYRSSSSVAISTIHHHLFHPSRCFPLIIVSYPSLSFLSIMVSFIQYCLFHPSQSLFHHSLFHPSLSFSPIIVSNPSLSFSSIKVSLIDHCLFNPSWSTSSIMHDSDILYGSSHP